MMRQNLAFLTILIGAVPACSKREAVDEQLNHPSEERTSSVHVLPTQVIEEKTSDRTIKTELEHFDFESPESMERNIGILLRLAKSLEAEKGLSHAEALNELYLRSSIDRSLKTRSRVRRLIDTAILKDPEGLAPFMGDLPAGELRHHFVAWIRGGGFSRQQVVDMYHAMPESADRSQVGEQVVKQTFYDQGVDSAILFIQSMTSPYERDNALNSLASSISSANLYGERKITRDDVESVIAYANSIGQDYPVRTLEKIKTPDL
jgi:hypothetical protein